MATARRRRVIKLLALGAVVAAATGAALGIQGVRADGDTSDVVHLTIHNSRFDRSVINVPAGRAVTFVVRNTDPIAHELIVGPKAVQLRHEAGTEPFHGDVPGEVTLPAGATGSTTYTAPTDGPVFFACHFPGHYAYGMHGVVRIEN
jgi:uncharacterized cupredoxin-like copper-binding protein